MPDITTTPTPILQPITSQDVSRPPGSQDGLEASQSADTFKALSELFDSNETATPPVVPQRTEPAAAPTPTPVGTETVTPTVTPAADDFEKTLEAIKLNPNAHPNQVKATDELRRISREEHKRAVELETKVKEYETKVTELSNKPNELPAETAKELEDLRTLRKEIDLRMDPEFNKQFIKPVQDAETNIMRILTEAGLKEDTAKWIQDHGGIVGMSRSNEIVDEKNGLTAQQWIEDVLLAKTPVFHRNRALGELTNALNTQDRGVQELQDFTSKAKERWDTKMQKLQSDFNAGRDAAIAELGDLVKPKMISSADTPEKQAADTEHNNRLRLAETKFASLLKESQDPKVAGNILVKAVQADLIMAENKNLTTRVAELQQQLDKVKAAGTFSRAGDNTPPPAATPPSPTTMLKQSDASALGDLLNKAGINR